MLRDIAAEVRQTGKAYRIGFVQDGVRDAAYECYGLNSYYSRKSNVTYFAEELRDAQLLAVNHSGR